MTFFIFLCIIVGLLYFNFFMIRCIVACLHPSVDQFLSMFCLLNLYSQLNYVISVLLPHFTQLSILYCNTLASTGTEVQNIATDFVCKYMAASRPNGKMFSSICLVLGLHFMLHLTNKIFNSNKLVLQQHFH